MLGKIDKENNIENLKDAIIDLYLNVKLRKIEEVR